MGLRNTIWEIRRLLIWIATLGGGSGITYILSQEQIKAEEDFCSPLGSFDYVEGEDYDDYDRCNDDYYEDDYYDDY